MNLKNCFLIGSIFKFHGYKGGLIIFNSENILIDVTNATHLFIKIDNGLVPFFIESIKKAKKNNFLVKFSDLNSEEDVKQLLKKEVYIDKKLIIHEDTKSSKISLLNYKVIDNNKGDLGMIYEINKQTAQELLYVKNDVYDFCFPVNNFFIKSIDNISKEIKVEIPTDILNLN